VLSQSKCGDGVRSSSARAPSAGPGGIRIFIADDHPLILDSFKGIFHALDPSAEVVGFTDIASLESVLTDEPTADLLLVDLHMPGLSSIDAVRDFIGRRPGDRVAVISGSVDARMAHDLIRAGCAGIIPKSLAPAAIYHAVRLMIGGGRFLPDCLAAAPLSPAARANDAPIVLPGRLKFGLTRREAEVLRCLATGQTNKQIARDLRIEEVTVKLHLRRCYIKLGVRNRIEAVRAVLVGTLDTEVAPPPRVTMPA